MQRLSRYTYCYSFKLKNEFQWVAVVRVQQNKRLFIALILSFLFVDIKKKLGRIAWIEVYDGQRSLAFELTTAILRVEINNKCVFGAMVTMDDYVSSHFM